MREIPAMRRLVRADPEDRWAAVFGRIAVYSFLIALVSGILLLPFFQSSMTPVVYHGSYRELDGLTVSRAYQSTLNISFDVRGGLLIRQVHHWSADLFVAAVCLRLIRVFFRGRFRRSHWLIWVGLLLAGMLAGFSGTILPDDMLSGGSLSVFTGVILSLPLVGTHLEILIFGGSFPGHVIIPRAYWVHIVVLPLALGGLVAAYPLLDGRIVGGRPPRGPRRSRQVALLPPKPADPANRIGVGVAGITLYGLLWAAAANDQIAYHLQISLYTVTWVFRVLVLAGPVLAFVLARTICHVVEARRRDEAEHGIETGRIAMTPEGGFTEIREQAGSR